MKERNFKMPDRIQSKNRKPYCKRRQQNTTSGRERKIRPEAQLRPLFGLFGQSQSAILYSSARDLLFYLRSLSCLSSTIFLVFSLFTQTFDCFDSDEGLPPRDCLQPKRSKRKSIRITSEEVSCHDLTGFRLTVVKNAAVNLLEAGGYQMEDAGDCWIHFTTRSSSRGGEEGAILKVLCAPVVNSVTRTKEVDMTCEELRKLRLRDMEANSENKNVDGQLLDSLVDGSIKFTLLQVKSTQAVLLEPGSGSKGGAFLQYNAARLAALQRKFRQLADEGLYPEMAEPEEVDFDLLKEPEEWGLLFNFLLEYPSLISRTAKEMASGKSNVHQICDFLSKLCSLFSVYYRRVRILLEPRDHLFRTIQARLMLAMSVEQVLENGLTILNIKKIEQM